MPITAELPAARPVSRRRRVLTGTIALFSVLLCLALLGGLAVFEEQPKPLERRFGPVGNFYKSVFTHPGLTLGERVEYLFTRGMRKTPIWYKSPCIACHGGK